MNRRRSRRVMTATILVGGVAVMLPMGIAPSARAVSVPVIIRAADGELADAQALIEGLGGTVEHQVGIINGFIGTMPHDHLDDLELHDAIVSVGPNAPVQMATSGYDSAADPNSVFNVGQITKARKAWSSGATGKGIGVAVIDTGVTPVQGLHGPGKVLYGPDFTPESSDPAKANLDGYGHGTFMAGLIAGNDEIGPAASNSGDSSAYLGIAPDATIISVKVGQSDGQTVVGAVIMALDWVVQHAADPDKNIRVVNLSFSTNSSLSYLEDPLAFAAERAWFSGLVVVTSAGNAGGSQADRLTMPAVDPYVIAVGADHTMGTMTTGDDDIPTFSSRGNGERNPDFVAPGVSLQGLRVPGSTADVNFGATAGFGTRFFRGSGTSQAAAIVSGAAALLISQRPFLAPDDVKAILRSTASRLPTADAQAQGAGLIDVGRAMKASEKDLKAFAKALKKATKKSSGLGSISASAGDWSGTTWSGNTWSGNTWSGNTWSGNTWSGSTWSGSTWSGSTWSGSTWTTGSWQ